MERRSIEGSKFTQIQKTSLLKGSSCRKDTQSHLRTKNYVEHNYDGQTIKNN